MRWLAKLLRFVPARESEGISLGDAACWELLPPRGSRDLPLFLRALDGLFPEHSVLYLEDGTPSREIRKFLEERAAANTSKVAPGTIWPRPEVFHMKITSENLQGLAELAERAATPEIAVHIHVCNEDKVLLEWYDAFVDPFRVSKSIVESEVKRLAQKLGATCKEHNGNS